MTSTTYPAQILDRPALMARYRASRAAGNDRRATAILAVVNDLDHRSQARVTSGRPPPYPTVAECVDTLVRMYWWWTAPALTPTRRARLR